MSVSEGGRVDERPEVCPAYDVIIVGGGPVGLGLAIELGQREIRCLLLERHERPQPIPKGQNLTQRTLEHFHFWNAEKELRLARTIPKVYGIGGVTAYGTLLGGYHYDWLQRELVRPYYFMDNERLPQYATESVLRRRVAQLESVSTWYGATATGLSQDEKGVTVGAVRLGIDTAPLRARYVVGCDGSQSFVREAGGVTQTRSDHDRLMVLLVFRSEELHRLLEVFPNKSFFNVLHPDLQGYWQFFGRVDLGSTWFFHAPVPAGTTRENFDFKTYLHRAVGASFEVTIDHVGFWDLRVAIADRYRNARLFIAGDAAHSHPPYGGYGINTGLEDAVNLGWKLAAAVRGWAQPALLDSYEEERRCVFESTARDFIEQSIRSDKAFLEAFDPGRDPDGFDREWYRRGLGATSEVNSFEPHYEGSSIVAGRREGRSSAVGAHEFAARAGHHLAPRVLSSGRNIYEELGPEFTLVDFTGGAVDLTPIQRDAEADGIPLKTITEPSDDLRRFYQTGAMLIRPDQYVAWTAEGSRHDPAGVLPLAAGGRRRIDLHEAVVR